MAVTRKVNEDGIPNEDLTHLVGRMQSLGLVRLGMLRASWLLHDKPYCSMEGDAPDVLADLLLSVAMIARVSRSTAIIADDSVCRVSTGRPDCQCLSCGFWSRSS